MESLKLPRSPERLAFIHYLRNGEILPVKLFAPASALETKFNPYHDPRNGQFTFAPSGGLASISDGVFRPADASVSLTQTEFEVEPEPEPLRGVGDNSRGFLDPMTIEGTFPSLKSAPGNSIVAMSEDALALFGSGAASGLTSSLTLGYTRALIANIKEYDPSYQFQSLGFPGTFEGQIRQINNLRWDRAAVIYRITGSDEPLKVETIRYLQDRVDAEYDNALAAAASGDLPPAPTERMAIGNYIDRAVKNDLRDMLRVRELSAPIGSLIRVSSREYDTSGSDLTYSVPDVSIGTEMIDITIWRKLPTTRQIRRFFASDTRPRSAIMIRPRQLGPENTYAIKNPGR